MKLKFIGAAHEVTGSCTLISACGKNILVDCGMEQGRNIYENCDIPISMHDIDFVLLTHAHIDHSGKIPYITKLGFEGEIHTTKATFELCKIMLLDSAHIQEFEAQWRNRKAKRSGGELYEPLYTIEDAQKALELYKPCGYNQKIEICDGISIKFTDAGHLLGSASIEITICENGVTKTIIFSGDLGNIDRPLIKDPQIPQGADIVVIESTYGTRLHGERHEYTEQLTKIIQQTFDAGGNVVIPSFAVGRTQEILYCLRQIKESGAIKNHDGFKVYVDSPLAVDATQIYSSKLYDYFDEETLELLSKGINPIQFKGLTTAVSSEESQMINFDKKPKVIISASGMCDAGRIRHHLKHNLWRSECTVLFVGYQSEGTLGRALVNGADTVKLFGERVQVNAKILEINGISGHADRDMLLGWIKGMEQKPCRIYVNHGADTVCDEFAKYITESTGIEAVAPYSGGEYDIVTGECLCKGNDVRIDKSENAASRKHSSVFDRLLAAGRRLLSVIENNKDGANKDLAKFADQITALCDKWDR